MRVHHKLKTPKSAFSHHNMKPSRLKMDKVSMFCSTDSMILLLCFKPLGNDLGLNENNRKVLASLPS